MTERASPLPAAHCVRLDYACDGAIITPTFRKAPLNQEHSFLSASSPSQALRASSPKGRAFSRRQTFRSIQNLSLWERWHREAMTERASPLPAAHRVRLDCACDGAACACDRAACTCDRANGFIFPTHDHLLPPLPTVASGLRQSHHRARGVARHIISDAIKIRCARRLTPPGTPLRGIVISPAYNVGRCK